MAHVINTPIPILLALQPWVSLGLLDNQSPLLPILCLLCPLSYLHYPQICYIIIHPSQTRSSFPPSYKQISFHHPSWHCPSFHSLYMAQPSVINTIKLKTMAFRKMELHSWGQWNIFRLLKLYGICVKEE